MYRQFQLRSCYSFLGKVRNRDTLKLRTIAISQNRKWRHQNKKVYQIFMIIYQSWKFHENRPNRFREIFCTKSVRKKKNNKNREKETIQLDTISLRATSRSSVLLGPKISNIIVHVLVVKRYWYDRNSTVQASLEARRPIFQNSVDRA